MKIRLLKKIKKEIFKKGLYTSSRASWDYYAIITPEKEINIYFS